MKFAVYSLALSATLYCVYARAAIDEGEACIVQYLKRKGKLSEDFPTTLETPSSHCEVSIPISTKIVREAYVDKINETFPNQSQCLIDEFDNREIVDHVLKVSVISESKKLSENSIKTQLEAARSDLKQDLEKIAIQCNTVDEAFTNIFNDLLGIKNETLAVFQYEYCISKYTADNSLLPLNNVELNPHHIDIEHLNCTAIIEKERTKAVKEIRDKMTSTPNGDRYINCILNAYNRNRVFDWSIALKVLYIVELPKETKESEKAKATQKIADFSVATFTCIVSGSSSSNLN
jgi:hypothetical protein